MKRHGKTLCTTLLTLLTLLPGTSAAMSLDDMVRKICDSPEAFYQIQSIAQRQSLAPALAQVLKNVNQSKCWSNASMVLSMMGPSAKETLPEILDLVKGTTTGLSGPMRELQQAFAIAALPSVSGAQAMQSIRTLMDLMANANVSSTTKSLSATALIKKYSAIDSYQMLMAIARESDDYARNQINQQQIQRIILQLRAQTQREAIKWISLFDRELKKLNATR